MLGNSSAPHEPRHLSGRDETRRENRDLVNQRKLVIGYRSPPVSGQEDFSLSVLLSPRHLDHNPNRKCRKTVEILNQSIIEVVEVCVVGFQQLEGGKREL